VDWANESSPTFWSVKSCTRFKIITSYSARKWLEHFTSSFVVYDAYGNKAVLLLDVHSGHK